MFCPHDSGTVCREAHHRRFSEMPSHDKNVFFFFVLASSAIIPLPAKSPGMKNNSLISNLWAQARSKFLCLQPIKNIYGTAVVFNFGSNTLREFCHTALTSYVKCESTIVHVQRIAKRGAGSFSHVFNSKCFFRASVFRSYSIAMYFKLCFLRIWP